jgi:preprotein translocase subunit SecG
MSAILIVAFCAIACSLVMGLMMLFMHKGHGSSHPSGAGDNDEIGDGDAG